MTSVDDARKAAEDKRRSAWLLRLDRDALTHAVEDLKATCLHAGIANPDGLDAQAHQRAIKTLEREATNRSRDAEMLEAMADNDWEEAELLEATEKEAKPPNEAA